MAASRIISLVLVALGAAALVYLHAAGGAARVSVPAGARAGQLTLHACTYGTERGRYEADCGTLVVPENRHNPRSRLIALPVTRIRARSAHPGYPLFRLQGGPGISNMTFEQASRFAGARDVVLVGYRGVDGSVRLDCPEVSSARERARDLLTPQAFRTDAAAFAACARRLTQAGVDLAGYTLPERVDDLDAARRALGYGRIDLLSESAGTRTALIYAWRHPQRIHRSVLVGVNPPGAFLWDAKTTGEQVGRYAALCQQDTSCRGRTSDLAASLHAAFAHLPRHWWFLPVKRGNVEAAAFFGLMNATTEGAGPLAAPWTIDSLLAAERGDASGAWLLSVMAQLVFPRAQVWGDVAAVGRSDAAYARRFFAAHRDRGFPIGSPGADLIWAGGRLLDAWPASPDENEYTRVRRSTIPTLLVGGSLDVATPPQTAARSLLPQLPNGRQVVVAGMGHTDDFWSHEPAAGSHLVNTFLASGKVDASRYTRSDLDFTPIVGQTGAAKIALGTLLAVAGLAALTLLWLPIRVRRRGRLGRKGSAATRALWAPVLGLGGWFAGVLVALTALPTVPLESDVLVGISVGVPVGLGVYWGWLDHGRPARTNATALAASLAAALVGAWLGCNATGGLLSPLTAVLGATVGANSILLWLDVVRDRPVRQSVRQTSTNEGGTTMYRAPERSNLAARMGRWSAAHWKTATIGWLAFVVVAFGLGGMVGMKNVDSTKPGPGQSGRMDAILDAGFKQPAAESVLIQSRSARAGTPAFDAAVRDVGTRLAKLPAVQNVHPGRISKDGRSALVEFEIRGDKHKATDKIQPVVDGVAAAQRAHPGFFIGEFGEASAVKGIETAYGNDLGKAGQLSIPVTLVILVLAFGALVAAGIPLLLALSAIVATFGLIALPSHVLPVAFQAPAMVLLIGLAVGVDYSMFYLKRERQERAAGRSQREALAVAAATSGRSVLVSGLTVMVAMAGMFLTSDAIFASLAVATILVVAASVLGSLTVLPALLSRLGDKVDRARVPFAGRLRRDGGDSRVWGAIIDRVLRRPVLSALAAAALLLALAAPALHLHTATPGVGTYPKSVAAVQAYDRMQQAFPGKAMPANVIVKAADVNAPAVRAAIGQLERRALASGRMHGPFSIDVNPARTVANITVPIDGQGTDAASRASLAALREIVPQTVGALPHTQAGVTGQTARWIDSDRVLKSKTPLVVAFVLLFAFALMLVAFRSIVVAIKAIVLNLLSVAAAYGVLALGFGDVDPVVPLLLFVILFGLSMDYHVFILSRIRETFDRGASMDDAVAHGIKSTAGVVTSAAIVMVAVFSIFATLSVLFFKEFGVGLAAAILIDATLVRAVLLPATMKLLGEWNWYLPRWLQWLPRTDLGEPAPAAEPKATPVSA